MGLNLPDKIGERLLMFVDLLEKWNKTFNLTALQTRHDMIVRHCLDSLVVTPYLRGPLILDVGSGAGLPGIPLALACPDDQFVLLDSNRKKTRFMTQVVAELQIHNVSVITQRIEQHVPAAGYNTILSRAFAELAVFIQQCGHLCLPTGQMLAMKGPQAQRELEDLPAGYSAQLIPVKVPGLEASRCIIRIRSA